MRIGIGEGREAGGGEAFESGNWRENVEGE